MRNAFIKALTELAEKDERVFLIVGDLGFGVIEDFQKRFPNQFVNVGVAEQNMTGTAAGLALSGKIVFTYSIGNFPTLRCLEQIRNDICYHNLNVNIVTVGGGFAYGALGSTHHATEDLAIMRALPNMTVVAPGDPTEAKLATPAVAAIPGPCYLRLARSNDPIVHNSLTDFSIGKAIRVREGGDLTLIATGSMLAVACAVAAILESQNCSARVISMHTVKPIDLKVLRAAAVETKLLVTLEDHNRSGGFGSAILEALNDLGLSKISLKRFALPNIFTPFVGSQEYLRQQHGLTAEYIAKNIFS